MGRSCTPTIDELDRVLGTLPAPFMVHAVGSARFVVGATGAYLVLLHDGVEEARSVVRVAATIRSALAELMSWVPYVHPMLVTPHPVTAPQATVVSPERLFEVLTTGRPTLEDEILDRLAELLDGDFLAGFHSLAPGVPDAKMGQCPPLPASPGSRRPPASRSPSTISAPQPPEPLRSSRTPPAFTAGSGSRSPAT